MKTVNILYLLGLLAGALPCASRALSVTASVDRPVVGMGQTVAVTAMATEQGRPVPGRELWAYREGRRWGAPATTDAKGKALFLLPLPYAGTAHLQIVVRPPVSAPAPADWIWASHTRDSQAVRLRKVFTLSGPSRRVTLLMTCDDQFTASLNGHVVLHGDNFQKLQRAENLQRWLVPGENTLRVDCRNGTGPAGLLGRLEIESASGIRVIATDPTWRAAEVPSGAEGAAQSIAHVGAGVWGVHPQGWPGMMTSDMFPVGKAIPAKGPRSKTLTVRVQRRTFD